MAKVTGPLLSISAAGTVGDAVTFRRAAGKNIVSAKSKGAAAPSAAQLAERQRAAWAAESWRAIDGKAKPQWLAAAAAAALPVFGLYMREFILQQCGAGDQPMFPAT
jgi:hypothetical protein